MPEWRVSLGRTPWKTSDSAQAIDLRDLPQSRRSRRPVEGRKQANALIGRSRSNTAIARQRFATGATVKNARRTHFSRLDPHDRAQAVVVAHETGLVQPGS